MTGTIISLFLFGLPFVVFPFGPTPFEASKVLVAEIVISILIVRTLFGEKNIARRLSTTHVILVAALALLTVLQLVFASSTTAFFGNVFRLQGIVLLWYLLAFSLVASLCKAGNTKLIATISLILLAITTIFSGQNAAGRAIGTFGEPNALAATAVFLLPFIVFTRQKILQLIGCALALIVILLSGSQSALIAFFLTCLFIFLPTYFGAKYVRAFIICVVLLLLSLFLPFLEKGGVYEQRVDIWQTAIAAGASSPAWGHGFGNITEALHEQSAKLGNTVEYQFVDSSHNLLLDIWVQGGILGLALIVTLLFLATKTLFVQQRYREVAVILGLLTTLSFNPASVTSLIVLWYIIGRGFQKEIFARD